MRDAPGRISGPSVKDVKAAENNVAIGGMRNPHRAVRRVPELVALGTRTRRALLPFTAPGQAMSSIVATLLSGGSVEAPPENTVVALRGALARELGAPPPAQAGLDPALYQAIHHLGDPDPHVHLWLASGAPLGIRFPVPASGVFPPVPDAAPAATLADIVTNFDAFSNYQSAEEAPDVCTQLLKKMTDRDWAVELIGLDKARAFLGA